VGYVDLLNRVVAFATVIVDYWKDAGANIDFTTEELAMVAINHELGEFGTTEAQYYIDNDSELHVKNRGKLYKLNSAIAIKNLKDNCWLQLIS
jgi:hypothetical protein